MLDNYTTNPPVEQPESRLSDLAELPIWAARGKEPGKRRRAPVNPETGGWAMPDKSATWGSRARAEKRAARFPAAHQPGVGLMLGEEAAPEGYVLAGLDLDGCRDPETGHVETWAEVVVDRFDSYTEASPSRGGLHVLFWCRTDDLTALRGAGLIEKWGKSFARGEHIEIAAFFGHKFLTVTDEVHEDLLTEYDSIRPVARDTLEWLLGGYGPKWAGKPSRVASTGDNSGSGYGFRLALDALKIGGDEDSACAMLAEDDGPAGEWWHRTTDRERRRAIERAAEALANKTARLVAMLDDLPPEPDAPLEGNYTPDHDGAIRAYADKWKGKLRYAHDRGYWYAFTRQVWEPERTALARDLARRVCVTMADAAGQAGKMLRPESSWSAVERGARADRAFAGNSTEFDLDPMLLGTPGGVVDLRTGELRDGQAHEMVSKRSAVTPVPVAGFDPARDCPQWVEFLGFALGGDAEAVRFLQQWAGYSLTGLTTEQKLLFIHGGGGNGKGVTVNTLARVAGDYAANVPASTLTAQRHEAHPTELARLQGVRFAHASEVERDAKWADQRVKSLTGGDPITARLMRGDFFTFDPQLALTVVGNDRPTFGALDDAMRRRFLLLEMDRKPPTPDPDLPDKLWTEAPGILAWMIRGALDWQQNGLVIPSAVKRATEDYFLEEDHFARFLDSCCEVTPRGWAATADLLDAYDSWAFGEVGAPPMNKRAMGQEMKRRGFTPAFERVDGKNARGFRGIHLRGESEGKQ